MPPAKRQQEHENDVSGAFSVVMNNCLGEIHTHTGNNKRSLIMMLAKNTGKKQEKLKGAR